MSARTDHDKGCACCAAYATVVNAFSAINPDGQVGSFVDGLLQGAAHIAAAHVLPGKEELERQLIGETTMRLFDFYVLELGKATRE